MLDLANLQQEFMNMSNELKLVSVSILVLIIYIIYRFFFKSSEDFAQINKTMTKQEKQDNIVHVQEISEKQRDEDVKILPQHYDPDTRTIMAGAGFIPQSDIMPPWGDDSKEQLVDGLDDGNGGDMGFHYNLCSPSCCSSQYPTPHKLEADPLVCGNKSEFAPTPFTCNNSWQNAGCLCANKSQVSFLTNRGGNL